MQDSDLNGVVALRYTGGARMLLLIELGRQRRGGMRVKVPYYAFSYDILLGLGGRDGFLCRHYHVVHCADTACQ